jgi:hypothetical protein
MSRRRSRAPGAPEADSARRPRGRELFFAFLLGLVAAVLLWIGDMHLTHRDWLVGAVVFGLGLVATGLTVRQLRRAGLVR